MVQKVRSTNVMTGVAKKMFQFFICKNIKTKANLSHPNDDDSHSFRCVELFFSRHFLVHYVVFLFYFFWERSGVGQGNRHNALHAVLLLYLITGCFMIMLLYVLRLTSLFMCHVFAIKKALISSFTCPVATHTKCEMCYLLSVVDVVCALRIRAFVLSAYFIFLTCMLCLECAACIRMPQSIWTMIVAFNVRSSICMCVLSTICDIWTNFFLLFFADVLPVFFSDLVNIFRFRVQSDWYHRYHIYTHLKIQSETHFNWRKCVYPTMLALLFDTYAFHNFDTFSGNR